MQATAKSFVTALALLAAACNQSSGEAPPPSESATIEEVKAALDPKRAEVEAVRAKLRTAVEAAKAHPELFKIASPPSDPASMLLADEEARSYDFKSLWCAPSDYRREVLFGQLDKPYPVRRFDFENLAPTIPTVLSAKMALVCRTTRLDPLLINKEAKTYTGGYFEGECRLFELDGTKYLGGFALRQGIPDELKYGGYNPTPSSFSSDLGNAVTDAMNTAMWGAKKPEKGLFYGCNFPDK